MSVPVASRSRPGSDRDAAFPSLFQRLNAKRPGCRVPVVPVLPKSLKSLAKPGPSRSASKPPLYTPPAPRGALGGRARRSSRALAVKRDLFADAG